MRSALIICALAALAACSAPEPAKFETEDLGNTAVSRHDKGRTGVAFRKQTCRFSVRLPNLVLSYEGTEGQGDREAFSRCLSMRNGDRLRASKVTHIKGAYKGPKVRYFVRTDSGLTIEMH